VRRDMIRFLKGIHGETQVKGLLIGLSAKESVWGGSGGALRRRRIRISTWFASFRSHLFL